MQIKTLEDALGKPLFKRNTRHVEITAEGMALLDYGRRMLTCGRKPGRPSCARKSPAALCWGCRTTSPLLAAHHLAPVFTGPSTGGIHVIGRPSSELIPLLEDCTLDLACITRTRISGGTFV
jgi:DNA-binding transcriptional LysR family regulator